jgi:hypothetical protein
MRRLAALAFVIAFVAGCGGGKPGSYVGATGDSVVYVTWKRSDTSLTGELTRTSSPGGTQRVAFTGTADGSTLSLRLAHALGTRTTLNGALVGHTLTLDYPGEGESSTIRLLAADQAAYAREAAALHARVAGQAASTPAPSATTAATAGDPVALMKTVRADAAQIRSDESFNYTDTICDDVNTLDAAVKQLTASSPPHADLAEAKALQSKAHTACAKANGGS